MFDNDVTTDLRTAKERARLAARLDRLEKLIMDLGLAHGDKESKEIVGAFVERQAFEKQLDQIIN